MSSVSDPSVGVRGWFMDTRKPADIGKNLRRRTDKRLQMLSNDPVCQRRGRLVVAMRLFGQCLSCRFVKLNRVCSTRAAPHERDIGDKFPFIFKLSGVLYIPELRLLAE